MITVGQLKNILNQYRDNCPVAIVMPKNHKRASSYIIEVKEVMIHKDGDEIERNKNVLTEVGKKNWHEGIAILGK